MKNKPLNLRKPKVKLNKLKKKLYEKRDNPEAVVQEALIKFLKGRGWHVKEMHASAIFSGFPDLYATHVDYGSKLIEVKLPGMIGSKFTDAQLREFPKLVKNGSPIWIMTGTTEKEYKELITKPEGNLERYFLLKT